jgi:hypothetical protein
MHEGVFQCPPFFSRDHFLGGLVVVRAALVFLIAWLTWYLLIRTA